MYFRKQLQSRSSQNKEKTLPGPKPVPVFGNSFQVDIHRLHLSLYDFVKDYGKIFQINLMGQTLVILNDASLVRKAFGSMEYGDVINDRPATFFGKYVLGNCGIALANWDIKMTIKRKLWHSAFRLYGNSTEHYKDVTKGEMARLVEDIEKTKGNDVDVYSLLNKSVANSMIRFMTGTPPEANDVDQIWQFTNVVDIVLNPGTTMIIYDVVPFVRHLPGYFGRLFQSAVSARDYILERCYFRFKRLPTTSSEGKLEPGFINALIQLQTEHNRDKFENPLDDEQIKGIVLDIITGGVVSTTANLTNIVALLLVHKHIAKRVQEEIDTIIGTENLPSLSDKDRMPYTMATILEGLRYTSGGGPLGGPHVAKSDVTFEGFYIAKGAVFFANQWFIHHDPSVWSDPWVFNPERFLDEEGRLLQPDDDIYYNLMPFSAGRRKCMGEEMALSLMFLYVATIFQSYDVCVGSDGVFPDINPRNYLPVCDIRVKDYVCRAFRRE